VVCRFCFQVGEWGFQEALDFDDESQAPNRSARVPKHSPEVPVRCGSAAAMRGSLPFSAVSFEAFSALQKTAKKTEVPLCLRLHSYT
jgi:hypothetical protein